MSQAPAPWLAALADAVLALHVAYVAFVVAGLALVLVGGWQGWAWVRNRWFRFAHLLAIAVVVVQSWLGLVCPLTTLEMYLRERSGGVLYSTSFIGHWLQALLYYEAPVWAFALIYSAFGLLVAASWHWVRPQSGRRAA
jgi:hypothetical protein